VPDAALKRYAEFFESLTADRLASFDRVMTDDVRFTDPFNSVQGLERVRGVFADMYTQMSDARFTVTHAAMAEDGSGLLRWELDGRMQRNGESWHVEGMSHVRFAPDGRVCEHIDHWDAARQFYERLPVIGWLLRRIRARVAH
jgi:steroid delta-isomerase